MKEDLIPVTILSIVTVYVFAHILCLYYRSIHREERSRARERILRDRISDVKEQNVLLQEANKRLGVLVRCYENGWVVAESDDEILSAEYIGND